MANTTPVTAGTQQGSRWNLIIFTILAVLYTLFFLRHLKTYVSGTLLVGGTISLLGLWNLVWNAVAFGGGEKPDDWIRRMLNAPNSLQYLLFAALLLVILFAGTSSIYLSFGHQTEGHNEFVVEVWDENRMVLPPVKLNAYDRDIGRPYFFRTAAATLTYRITTPTGYEALTRRWAPWSQHQLMVPDDFVAKELHLLRIFAGPGLVIRLPDSLEVPGAPYMLSIEDTNGTRQEIRLTKGLVLAGMGAADLASRNTETFNAAAKQAVDNHYAARNFSPEAREPTVIKIIENRRPWPTPEWKAGQELQIQVVRGGEALINMNYRIPEGENRIHDIVLEGG